MNSSSNRLIVAMLVVAALAAGFWILILSPQREEAGDLSAEAEQLRGTLISAEAQAAEATAARSAFPADYRKLVVLGKAVPGGDEFSSLLVELNRVAANAGAEFQAIQLASDGGESAAATTTTTQEAGPTNRVDETVPPTEAAAALMPLGSSIGPAGLSVMPYDLTFTGSYFSIAEFIRGIDSMVITTPKGTTVEGRLVTLDSFVLSPVEEGPGGAHTPISANFSVTTYLAPSSGGVTAGATETAPAAAAEAAPEEAQTGTPSSYSTPSEAQ